MIPKLGSFCELCPLPVHYLLTCASCSHAWEEPSFPGEVTCPHCGAMLLVTATEHAAFKRLALEEPAPLARCDARARGWAERERLAQKRSS
jgi:DNA-directed RNA polymerase subunit RPC12/RpoP